MMSEVKWRNGDDENLREIFGYLLRDHVAYQDGRNSEAPSLLFADGDYEVGDGTCGLHPDGKQCNEPVIIYARADALVDALARVTKLEEERDLLRQALANADLKLIGDEANAAINRE